MSHPAATAPVGVVLAGGRGRRLGGDKAIVELERRPLVRYPLDALHAVCDDVAVVAKRDTLLPSLAGVAQLWIEPDEPRHPLTGVVHALRAAAGRPILVVAVDLPLVDPATLQAVLDAAAQAPDADAVVPRSGGRLQPLCALYRPGALTVLEGFDPGARVTALVQALSLVELEPLDAAAFHNINRPEDLLEAAVRLRGRVSPR